MLGGGGGEQEVKIADILIYSKGSVEEKGQRFEKRMGPKTAT